MPCLIFLLIIKKEKTMTEKHSHYPKQKMLNTQCLVYDFARYLGNNFSRYARLIEMGAPSQILINEEKLINKRLAQFTNAMALYKCGIGELVEASLPKK